MSIDERALAERFAERLVFMADGRLVNEEVRA